MAMPMNTKHTRGQWRLVGDRIKAGGTHRLLPVAGLFHAKGHEAEDAATPDLPDEQQRAQLVTLAMLNARMHEQKA